MEKVSFKELLGLAPPRAPIPIIGETSVDSSRSTEEVKGSPDATDSKPIIAFKNLDPKYQKWALSLETQRFYSYTKFGKVSRENIETIKRELQEREMELDIVKLMKRQQKPLFSAVMNEFKEKLEKLK